MNITTHHTLAAGFLDSGALNLLIDGGVFMWPILALMILGIAVIIERYPAAIKAFYMQPDPQDPRVALCDDMIAPEGYGEIIGGGQRLDDLDLLLQRIKEHDLPQEAFEWYLDLRRYGSVPHGGFGMGVERCVSWICGLEHVRETIPYPRMLYRLYP